MKQSPRPRTSNYHPWVELRIWRIPIWNPKKFNYHMQLCSLWWLIINFKCKQLKSAITCCFSIHVPGQLYMHLIWCCRTQESEDVWNVTKLHDQTWLKVPPEKAGHDCLSRLFFFVFIFLFQLLALSILSLFYSHDLISLYTQISWVIWFIFHQTPSPVRVLD